MARRQRHRLCARRDFIAELSGLAVAVAQGAIDVRAQAVPPPDVAQAWTADTDDRIVLVP